MIADDVVSMLFQKLNIPHVPKQKNEQLTEEYHDEDIHDKVYSTVLRQAYDMFKVTLTH